MFLPCDRCGLSLHRTLIHQGSKLKSNIAYIEIKVRQFLLSRTYLQVCRKKWILGLLFTTVTESNHRHTRSVSHFLFSLATLPRSSCNTMWPFIVLGVCVCARAGQRIFLSALVRNPHKWPNGETGSGGGKEGPREDRGSIDK